VVVSASDQCTTVAIGWLPTTPHHVITYARMLVVQGQWQGSSDTVPPHYTAVFVIRPDALRSTVGFTNGPPPQHHVLQVLGRRAFGPLSLPDLGCLGLYPQPNHMNSCKSTIGLSFSPSHRRHKTVGCIVAHDGSRVDGLANI